MKKELQKQPSKGIKATLVLLLIILLLEGYCRIEFVPFDFIAKKKLIDACDSSIPSENNLHEIFQFDEELLWSLRPYLQAVPISMDEDNVIPEFLVSTNNYGLRSNPIGLKGKRFRIVVLGDSLAFGIGLSDREVWPRVLESALNKNQDDFEFEVINAAVPGYTSVQGLTYLKANGLKFKPEIVITCFGLNDSTRSSLPSDKELYKTLDLKWWEKFLVRSRFYSAFAKDSKRKTYYNNRAEPRKARVSAKVYASTLKDLAQTCKNNNTSLMYLDWQVENKTNTRHREFEQWLLVGHQIASSLELPLIDLDNLHEVLTELTLSDNLHLNPTGARILAEEISKKIIDLLPYHLDKHNIIARSLVDNGETDLAISYYKNIIRMHPDYAEAYNNLGMAIATTRQFETAIIYFEKALELDPNIAGAYNNLGRVFAKQNKLKIASEQFKTAINLDPFFVEAYINLGVTLAKKGDYEDAIAEFNSALKLNPRTPDAYYNLGVIFHKQGRVDEALKQYRNVLRLKPDDQEALCSTADILLQQGKIDEAITHYYEVLRTDSHHIRAQNGLNAAYIQQKLDQQDREHEVPSEESTE